MRSIDRTNGSRANVVPSLRLMGLTVLVSCLSGCSAGMISPDSPDGALPDDAGGAVEPLDAGARIDGGMKTDAGIMVGADGGPDFDPDAVSSCANLGLSGTCVEVRTVDELMATQTTCLFRERCRVLIHPGTYALPGAVFTYHHWFRHYIGIRDANGNRPVITSKVGSVFANKGSTERPLNTILQNLVLNGPVQGVDFDGVSAPPFNSKGGLAWLDRVTVDMDSREIFFNSGPNPGTGSFWCTRCELIHRSTTLNPNSMIAIGNIDSAWFSDSTLRSDKWNNVIVGVGARSVRFDGVVDEKGNTVGCGSFQISCRDGDKPELLRAPTVAWFESLANAQAY